MDSAYAEQVTPCVGVWIEILKESISTKITKVTSCVGVWIEIVSQEDLLHLYPVTPCVGVWIEILIWCGKTFQIQSLPAREYRLKYICYFMGI